MKMKHIKFKRQVYIANTGIDCNLETQEFCENKMHNTCFVIDMDSTDMHEYLWNYSQRCRLYAQKETNRKKICI